MYLRVQHLKDKTPMRDSKRNTRETYQVGRRRVALGVTQLPCQAVMVFLSEQMVEQLVEHDTAHETLRSIILPPTMAPLEMFQGT